MTDTNREGMRFQLLFEVIPGAGVVVSVETPHTHGSTPLEHWLSTESAVASFVQLVASALEVRYQQDESDANLFWLVRPDTPWPKGMNVVTATHVKTVIVIDARKTILGKVTCSTQEDADSVASVFSDFFRRLTGFERAPTVLGATVGSGHIRDRTLSAPPPQKPDNK